MSEKLAAFRSLFPPEARRAFAWLCVLAAASGMLEMAGVAAVMPFMRVLAEPGLAITDPRIAPVLAWAGISSPAGVVGAFGAALLLMLVATNGFAAATALVMLRFAHRQGHLLAVRLLRAYLRQPYAFHLDRHSAELQKNVLQEVNRITIGMLIPGVDLIAKGFVALFLVLLLLAADPVLALLACGLVGAAYVALFRQVRAALHAAGLEHVQAGAERALHAQESLAAVKELRLLGRQEEMVSRFAASSLRWADAQAVAQAFGALPRYAIEAIAFGFVLFVTIYLLVTRGALAQVLPVLGLYAFAGYRLMPALHQIFADWAALRYGRAAFELVTRDLASTADEGEHAPPQADLHFHREISLEGIGYRYPGGAGEVLRDFSCRVPKNSTLALVGPTGCGKTTVIDILMGLLRPQQGRLAVDGASVTEANAPAWQKLIGHVPQQISLSDDTIARNIAFGIPDAAIDMRAVERAARQAKLQDFVATLPLGYATMVGERGVRLSGGQRQRIGIARALYHDPELVVLDEATSALDNVTENAVLDALQVLSGSKTIVMVAHRLSSVRACDRICVMEAGRIVESGRYDELLSTSERFRALAAAA
jgi:ABC-type multidrug transport system fused ATPase/permease subunit